MSQTRLAVAGAFALIGGAATLLMVASILQSCRQGGKPHDMGTDARTGDDSHAAERVVDPSAQPAVAANPDATKLTIG